MPDPGKSFTPAKTSPLAGLPGAYGGITIEERPFVGKVNLRGDADVADAASRVLGCRLPVAPNAVAGAGDYTVFWLGPDEWQVHCPEDGQHALVADLRDALEQRHAAIVDVSDYYVVVRLSGDRVLEVLAKGMPLDLHGRAFPEGCCAQTRYGHAAVLVHKLTAAMVDVQVRWSFAEYLWSCFVAGTREYRAVR